MISPGMNMSTSLGQCPRKSDCDRIFKIYMALSVVGSFISACGGTPGYIVLLRLVTGANTLVICHPPFFVIIFNGIVSLAPSSRSIQPDLKALALGMQTLIVRTLGKYCKHMHVEYIDHMVKFKKSVFNG